MSYYLPEGYRERLCAVQQLDRLQDLWQNEVYRSALELAVEHDLHTVLDFGTGSGFKLMKYFAGFSTVGADLPAAVRELQRNYPGRDWVLANDFDPESVGPGPDLLICADVVEHVDDPDLLLGQFAIIGPRWLVISTPDRDLLKAPLGPPANPQHVREWAFDEFQQYMSHWFHVVRHWHTNKAQATQCVIAQLKG